MSAASAKLAAAIRDLMLANRILANEGVVDGFGHVSMRHPDNPDRYLLARSRSPELVTEDDILEFDLDSAPIDLKGRTPYSERPIHGCIYKSRPDVMAVCHNHAHSLIPYGVTGTVMKPIFHFSAGIGVEVPIWDIRDDFGDKTNLLVLNNDQGRSLAKALGPHPAVLMRGHGSAVATQDLKGTVLVSIALMENAAMLSEARGMGPVRYLSAGEVEAMQPILFGRTTMSRAWEFWCRRAGFETDVNE